MAGKVQNVLNLEIVAGKAQPAPPLGPMLGANGVNIGQFTKEFNEKTQEFMQKFGGFDVKIKCKLTIYVDRTFKVEIGYPVTSNLILWKLKEKKGSGVPNKEKLPGKLTKADMEEIYEIKKGDMNAADLEGGMKIIAGTAKNMGIETEL
ncbi:MAG TPA: 50S ribosomal protein L11 [Candidatus Absconditabacterales bacterium]|nr:50S ribosomal protein L11 [Candidatus Absconditabacterales bacterium]